MCKRTKLSRIISRTPQIISQRLYIEKQISSSHLKEKIHEEHVAVFKIKVDPMILNTSLGMLKDTVFVNRRLVNFSTH